MFGSIWILFWSLITLLADLIFGIGDVRQIWACTYLPVPAVVIANSLEEGMDGEGGKSFRTKVSYAYEVDGQHYTSECRRYLDPATGLSTEVKRMKRFVDDFPAGAKITAYYNPFSHSDAVLLRGLESSDFLVLLFLLPFNVVMIGSWMTAREFLRGNRTDEPPTGVTFDETDEQSRMRFYPITRSVAAGIGILGSSFVMVFFVALGQSAFPLVPLLVIAWSFVLMAGFLGIKVAQRKSTEVRIDSFRGQVEIQANGEEAKSFAISDVSQIVVDEGFATQTEGVSRKTFQPVVVFRHGEQEQQRVSLLTCSQSASAEWIVNWLKDRLPPQAVRA